MPAFMPAYAGAARLVTIRINVGNATLGGNLPGRTVMQLDNEVLLSHG